MSIADGGNVQDLEAEIDAVATLAHASSARIAARSPDLDVEQLDCYSVQQAARILCVEESEVQRRLEQRELLEIGSEDGPKLPAFQFWSAEPAVIHPVVEQALAILNPVCIDARTLAAWFVAPKQELGDGRPMECLSDQGRHEALLIVARRDAARLS